MPRRTPINPPVLTQPTWEPERAAWTGGWLRVAGVDEAGRGPLAGPVVAAAVILPREVELPGLDDSKRLDAGERQRLYDLVVSQAEAWSVAAVDVEEIDRVNILRATHLAMARALSQLAPLPDGALVDGLPVSGLPCPHRALVDGDALCISIAAASVVAKVTRDAMMLELDSRFPGYGFARHKGYSTPEHQRALRELGPAACHRRSFRPVAQLSGLSPELPLWDEPPQAG
ncbi:MAG: ribonuclease HII [Armatimonadota bacterium]